MQLFLSKGFIYKVWGRNDFKTANLMGGWNVDKNTLFYVVVSQPVQINNAKHTSKNK